MEAPKEGNPQLSPELLAFQETNSKLKEWLQIHPNVEDTLKLPLPEKKEFVLLYYAEDLNADDLLEKMLEQAEKTLDAEIKKGNTKPPFSQDLVFATMAIAKAKIMDDLVEEVSKFYQERRKLIKGKEINDKGVLKVTQLNCSKMAMSLQTKILDQVAEEAKSRNFALDEFLGTCAVVSMSDVQSFMEIERIYGFRKAEERKNEPFEKEKVKEYVEESLKIAQSIIDGQIDSALIYVYPHLLGDKLFNLTGYEGEEIVNIIRKAVKEDKVDEELVDLIVKEAYAGEKSRENCQQNFDNQMDQYQNMMMGSMQNLEKLKNMEDPLNDPSIKKMIEMGAISKEEIEHLASRAKAGMFDQAGMPPGMGGMFPPGMEGMFPPRMEGMMPPGMEGMMPPGMEGMIPPGMEGMFPPDMPPELMMQMMMMGQAMFGGGMPPEMFGPGFPGQDLDKNQKGH